MALYNIYHGLGGGFGGANYDYTAEFETKEQAEKAAYDAAVEDYESYEGMHGLRNWDDVAADYCDSNDMDLLDLTEEDDEDISSEYREEIEGWIEYKAVLADEDDEVKKEEREYL